jgi:hypothetical protein
MSFRDMGADFLSRSGETFVDFPVTHTHTQGQMPMAMTPEHSVELQGVWEKWQLDGEFVEMDTNGTS